MAFRTRTLNCVNSICSSIVRVLWPLAGGLMRRKGWALPTLFSVLSHCPSSNEYASHFRPALDPSVHTSCPQCLPRSAGGRGRSGIALRTRSRPWCYVGTQTNHSFVLPLPRVTASHPHAGRHLRCSQHDKDFIIQLQFLNSWIQ